MKPPATVNTQSQPLLEVDRLEKHFPIRRGFFRRAIAQLKAVDGVSFALSAGETLCLVGESGCGKSTVGRTILRLLDPTAGKIRLDGEDITHISRAEMRSKCKRLQIIFQDPYASLNPRLTAGRIVAEPLENFEAMSANEREARVAGILGPRRCGATHSSFPAVSASGWG
jgi:ABC-type microcin C transport system duplicated ATPase subunit YejF